MKRKHFLISAGAFATVGGTSLLDSNLRANEVIEAQNTNVNDANQYADNTHQDGKVWPIKGKYIRTARHTNFVLLAGPNRGPAIIFVHGWPELSLAWRSQIKAFSSQGFRVIAPDLRGCGRSTLYNTNSAYAQREIVQDMIELVDALKIERAIWVGHDWGAPVVWNIATHHPERCHGVVGLTVPYDTLERGVERLREFIDRSIYPESQFPYGQYEYYKFYQENFDIATQDFEANITNTMKILLRQGDPTQAGKPFPTAFVRLQGGWFGPPRVAPDVPLDTSILSQAGLDAYVEAYQSTGFFGVNSLYMNDSANWAYADEAVNKGVIEMPVLFLAGAYDYINDTERTNLMNPMKEKCRRLTISRIESGHWMQHERAAAVNQILLRWIMTNVPSALPYRQNRS